ncbi:unnamed protein product, partial [Mesorhabditis belari]|uniref:THO complex subunit 2 n=1 Tax=Mesorhabditis belari TaxID=2138241 RepID=A0AAF3FN31_9BILA
MDVPKDAQNGETTTDLTIDELFEFCHSITEKKIGLDVAVDKLKTFSNETLCKLLDTISIFDQGIPATSKEDPKDANPIKEFYRILEDVYIPEDVLALEINAGKQDPSLTQASIRCRTKLYYKQVKFNMLREESEGFSKLVTELVDNDADLSANEICNRIFSLIGQFNLDPNRVCDVILECFEASLDQSGEFIDILHELHVNREYITTLLGFKFTFYHDQSAPTPYSIYLVAAHLIANKFVELSDICPYMFPSSDKIKELRQEQIANATKRAKHAEVIHTANIFVEAKAQPLLDSGEATGVQGIPFATVVAQQEAEDLKISENFEENRVLETNQKVGLICALCEIGAWESAKELLDCMPDGFAVSGVPRISRAIATMIEAALDEFYHQKCDSSLRRKSVKRNYSLKLQPSIPKVSDWTDLCELSKTIGYLGPRIGYRPSCYAKLLRLIHVFIIDNKIYAGQKNEDYPEITQMLDSVIIPGMTLLDGNCGIAEEVWTLLQIWKSSHTTRYPELLIQKGKLLGRTKYLLKRLSKESSRQMGRQLSKLCFVYPFAVFDYLLSQVQTFDNFIEPIVESIRYLSNLSFDILIYSIIGQLASSHKQQLNESDGSLSAWLQSLASLTGNVFKRYSAELLGMLHYIINQLRVEKSFDLLILREIVHMMGGIEAYSGLTQEHLEALSGGMTLRQEGASFAGAKNKHACTRLRETLLQGDLAISLYILMAQHHQCLVYKASLNYPLKLTGELVDQCRDTLLQYSEFVVTNLKNSDYCNLVPPIDELLGKYKLSVDMAMSLYRPVFMTEVYKIFHASMEALKMTEKLEEEVETEAEPGEVKEKGDKGKAKNGSSKLNAALEQSFFKAALEQALDRVVNRIGSYFDSFTYAKQLNVRTFCMFWLLSRYDLEVPTNAYEREIEKIRRQRNDLGNNYEARARRKEEERLKSVESKLNEELKSQKEHVERMHMALVAMKDDIFVATTLRSGQASSFLQTCLLTRAVISQADALYAAAFFKKLHIIRAANNVTVLVVDKLFSDVLPLLLGLTENEAASLGQFLQSMMELLLYWRNESVYEKECYNCPGFEKKGAKANEGMILIDVKGFQRLCFKYQFQMGRTFANLLQRKDEDYIVVRNSLLFLTKLLPVFPVVKFIADDLWTIAERLRDQEKGKRDDLSLKTASYMSHLKKRKVKVFESLEFASTLPKPVQSTLLPKPEPDNKVVKKRKLTKTSKSIESDDGSTAKVSRLTTTENGNDPVDPKPSETSNGKKTSSKESQRNGSTKMLDDGEIPPSPMPLKERVSRKVDPKRD